MMDCMTDRPKKITFAEMREMDVRGILVYCADYRCSHSLAISGESKAGSCAEFVASAAQT